MKKFLFKMYIRTQQGQEFKVGSVTIDANNYDNAAAKFGKMDLPFHHFSTVESIK